MASFDRGEVMEFLDYLLCCDNREVGEILYEGYGSERVWDDFLYDAGFILGNNVLEWLDECWCVVAEDDRRLKFSGRLRYPDDDDGRGRLKFPGRQDYLDEDEKRGGLRFPGRQDYPDVDDQGRDKRGIHVSMGREREREWRKTRKQRRGRRQNMGQNQGRFRKDRR